MTNSAIVDDLARASAVTRAPADTAAILGTARTARPAMAAGVHPDAFDTDWHGCPYANWFGGDHSYSFYTDAQWAGMRLQFLNCGNVEDNFTN